MEYFSEHKTQFSNFYNLIKFRVTEILLVSTAYDGFVLEEDGQLSERIYNEYVDLSIHFIPRIHHVSSAQEAFKALQQNTYDLIITMSRIGDMSPLEFGNRVKALYPSLSIVMLTYERLTPEMILQIREHDAIDRVFYWSGDSKILLAIIHYIEDQHNVEADSAQGVQVILVVEDSPAYYSHFLPIIYTEIMKQTRYLVSHAVNSSHRILRMRARPKILLAETYEEAMTFIQKYRDNLLGLISDIKFPQDGKINPAAGLELAVNVGKMISDLPILLQSEEKENTEKAKAIHVGFLDKNSPNLLFDMRKFILEHYGFGAFVFKYPDGRIIAEANDIQGLDKIVRSLPDESLYFHASNNDFSRWLRARTEFEIAEQLRHTLSVRTGNISEIRKTVLEHLDLCFKRFQSGAIFDFGLTKMDVDNTCAKIGSGSLGGKARGIAFINSVLAETNMINRYEGIRVKTPRTFVVCSEVFEEFMENNKLYDFALSADCDEAIARKFLAADLPTVVNNNLSALLQATNKPLAIRSSSILEDAQVLSFAGIYKTYFLPNNHENMQMRIKQISDAIKLIYACVFFKSPKQYVTHADLRIEEEKMAVLIQDVVGEIHGDLYYPVISGVAQSYNYYPCSGMKPEDGIVSLALGCGRSIVQGEQVYHYSPASPAMNPPYASPREYMKKSQSTFYALNMLKSSEQLSIDDALTFSKLPISRAQEDGTLEYVGSTYSPENDRIIDSIHIDGPKLITFAPILKQGVLPVTEIVKILMQLGKKLFGADVEIEFAINIPKDKKKLKEFCFLQIRPMIVGKEPVQVQIESYNDQQVLCYSRHAMGNGVYETIHDLIFVDPELFNLKNTIQIAAEIGMLNELLMSERRKFILIGFGRMATSDRWLGIPLVWSQMSQAMVVVEADRIDLQAEPSLGSHFYHNLTSLSMGYLHIKHNSADGELVDWAWLLNERVFKQTKNVKLIRCEKPIIVKIDGSNSTGVILKP